MRRLPLHLASMGLPVLQLAYLVRPPQVMQREGEEERKVLMTATVPPGTGPCEPG